MGKDPRLDKLIEELKEINKELQSNGVGIAIKELEIENTDWDEVE